MSQPPATVSTDTLLRWLGDLTSLIATDDTDRVDQLDALERLKAAAAAAQHRITVEFDASQRQAQRDSGVPERKVGTGIAAQSRWPVVRVQHAAHAFSAWRTPWSSRCRRPSRPWSAATPPSGGRPSSL